MKNIKLFERELNLIKNDELRQQVTAYLETATPTYFWEIGASSSGKYHPKFAQGEGGLVRHTKAVVMFAEELLQMSSYVYMKDIYKDYVIAACLVHDTVKYGLTEEIDKTTYSQHASNAANYFSAFVFSEYDEFPSEILLGAIKAHMGQWSTNKEDRPFTSVDRCVHMADYMASRAFIDIPSITEEWHNVEMEMVVAGELPF